MTLDDELRETLRAEGDRTVVPPDAWDRLRERVDTPRRSRWLVPVLAAAVVLLVAIGAWQLTRPDDNRIDVGGIPTTIASRTAPTTAPGTAAPTSTATTAAPQGTVAPPLTAPPSTGPVGPPTVIVAVTVDGRVVALDLAPGAVPRQLADLGDPRSTPPEGPGPNQVTQVSVTPDGTRAFYDECCEPASGAIYEVPTDGSSPPVLVGPGLGPAVSPDGRSLAFTAVDAVVVRDLATGAEKTFTDPAYRDAPLAGDVAWSLDGQRLYYPWRVVDGDRTRTWVVEVDVAAGGTPRPIGFADTFLTDPLALDDGLRVSLLTRAVRADGQPGDQDGEVVLTPDDLPPGVTVAPEAAGGSMTGVRDRNYDSRSSVLLVVLEDGRLVSGDQVLGTDYALADW
jgi:hypothetical protein